MTSLAVAHVTNVIGGGMGTVFRVLLPAQARRGDRVCLFARQAEPVDRAHFARHGVEVRPINSAAGLVRQLKEFDVVHLHSADLSLLVCGRLSRRPTVFTLHGLRAQTRPVGTVSLRCLPTAAGVRRRLKRVAFSFLLRHAISQVTTVSEFLAAKAASLYGLRQEEIRVVGNGIALAEFAGRPDRAGRDGTVVGWMGRLVPVKRVDVLLRAVAAAGEQGAPEGMRTIIVGDGDSRAELEALTMSLGLKEAVDFVGFVDAPQPFLAGMDLFVFPSRDEGSGLALYEALASGLPAVVLRDGGGAREVVECSGGGLVVADEQELAAAIVGLLADETQRRRLSDMAVAFAVREFDPTPWADRFDQVYRTASS